MRSFEGQLLAKDIKIAIILSKFNSFIGERLLEGALNAYYQYGGDQNNIDIYKVPGAYEIGGLAKKLMNMNKYDGIVCLGTIIRGATPHFEYVASNSAKAIMELSFEGKIPVIYGIITADNLEQAIDRAGAKSGNKGYDAMATAIEMVNLYRMI